jgi:TetR/AcrR family transcriptional regulator
VSDTQADSSDRRAQILGAAFEEFAAKGFRGATIKSIARAARLQSSALIYWYFPTKEALFQAVLGEQAPILRAIATPEALMDQPPEEVLPALAHAFLATAGNPFAQRLLRLVIGEALRHEELAGTLVAAGPRRVLAFLTTYLGLQIERGRLRPHNTQSSARAFIGMLIPQAAGLGLLPSLAEGGPTNGEHVATVVDIFLHGLRSEATPNRADKRKNP